MKKYFMLLGVSLLVGSPGAFSQEWMGYETLVNWSNLPSAKTGMTSHMASSWDRTGGNNDWNWYPEYDRQLNELADNGLRVTLLDIQGAGLLTRYWMPHATANKTRDIWITIDGQISFLLDTNAFFGGAYNADDPNLFKSPMIHTVAGGQMSYEPVAFATSLKVEAINRIHLTSTQVGGPINSYNDRHYYQLNYQLYSDGRLLIPYSGSLNEQQSLARQQAVGVLNNLGGNPSGESLTSIIFQTTPQDIEAGTGVSLLNLGNGESGMIRRLHVKMNDPTDAGLENLRLRVRYDGQAENAVDVPVGAFFGKVGATAPAYRSLPMGTDSSDGYYCYFPMPYRNGIVVELYNAGSEAVTIDGGTIEYETGVVAGNRGYFHAVHHVSNPGGGKHELLDFSGSGHYVGNILTLKALEGDSNGLYRGILESDETIVADETHILQGTGLEDAYNGGFYYNHVLVQNNDGDPPYPESHAGPFSGLLWMSTVNDRPSGEPDIVSGILQVSQFRWMLQDLVPFENRVSVEIENHGSQGALFESTAFFYVIPEPEAIPGDYNGDGTVDLADYTVWADHYGQSGPDVAGDGNNDGTVDLADYTVWADHYGQLVN
jgi:hypothetical protein